MTSLRLIGCGLLLPLLALAACAGDGEGLDANGNPIGSGSSTGGSTGSSTGSPGGGSGGITASFQSIQDNVFTPICSVCHAGAGAPEGMQLSAGVSYDMIVNVASQEQPELDRIKPGDPDDSYLLQKIEGTAATGAQMPDGCPVTQPCLDQATIDAIRQWVSDGAPNN
jgi:hypothetical protein